MTSRRRTPRSSGQESRTNTLMVLARILPAQGSRWDEDLWKSYSANFGGTKFLEIFSRGLAT